METAPASGLRGPSWTPDLLDLEGMAHTLSVSKKQLQRLLAAGRLPAADCNLSGVGGVKGRRWRRDKLLRFLEGQGC